jgi:signal transduction histidine kinase
MFERIRAHLVAWNLLVLGCLLLLVGGAAYGILSRNLMGRVDQTLSQQADEIAGELQRQDFRAPGLRLEREGYRGGAFALVVGGDGRVLANPQGVDLPPATFRSGAPAALGDATVSIAGEPARVASRPVRDRNGAVAELVVGQSLAAEQDTLHDLLLVFLGGGILGIALSLVGAWFLAGRALVPIRRAFGRQQEFVADASHELRTPLTVLRAAVDLLDQHRGEPLEANAELLDDLRDEIGRLERLTGDLLTLARSDAGELGLEVGEVELGAFVSDVARRIAPLARARRVEVQVRTDDAALVEADPDRLQQVLLILLDNALKYSRPGGQVRVVVRHQGDSALIEVGDDGEGIPPEHVPRIFERFYRVDRARSRREGGAGLGLAIARTLVDAHGGHIGLVSTLGAGTTVTIRLPRAAPAESLVGRLSHLAARIAERPLSE